MQLWRPAARRPKRPHAVSESERILGALESAHDRLTECLERLDEVTGQLTPDGQRHACCRRDLAEAKQERAAAVQAAFDYLSEHVTAEQTGELEGVRLLGQQTLLVSAEHVRSWPADSIAWHWSHYHAASRAVRSHWLDLIEAEQRVLCRLLRAL